MPVQLTQLSLTTIESRVCDIAAEQMGIRRAELHPNLRLIEDLHCDSLDMVELIMEIEDEFDVTIPDQPQDMVYKSVFTREPFRLRDLAELVYLQLGTGKRQRGWTGWLEGDPQPSPVRNGNTFTQLGGSAWPKVSASEWPFEPLGKNQSGFAIYRRRTDGMICVRIPAADVMIGTDGADCPPDERPIHRVHLDEFRIDQEPVSTTAFCRFLNSIGDVPQAALEHWFVLAGNDKRREHMLIRRENAGWTPVAGTERMPMMLVTWHGANAYSLWANQQDWRAYANDDRKEGCTFLPSEAQWEYAARGPWPRLYPWGDEPPAPSKLRFAQHRPGQTYRPETLPMADVNEDLGLSQFGLRHMAGNVWQWCADWYSPDFYATPQAAEPNPVNRQATGIRSERGGSWIGPAFLCRSNYRRGRVPTAKGRCLGFRCVSRA
ncbi:MAG TPA: SUMF1/EgtB/PvdO family nonheme iron enzyme [Tepidisphaeraceae bacterium]|nr:SUMF1/EgtB/PvdO family nonheme iron enzyme [Tepidisphaeraceae bacterium]